MNATITMNEAHKGIEIAFTGKPSAETRDALKAAGFRWHGVKKLWYAVNTPDRLTLAGKISRECGNGATLAEQSAKTAKEKRDALTIPEAQEVDGGGLYDGWKGGNYGKWHSEAELKDLLKADYRAAGIKATFRFPRAGYLTKCIVTITMSRAEILPLDEWLALDDNHLGAVNWWDARDWLGYTDDEGKYYDLRGLAVRDLPEAERDELGEKVRRYEYNRCISILSDASTWYKPAESVLTVEGHEILNKARAIVGSYNKDCSNSMIDYFDRAIYDDYVIKFVD